jgi:flagellar FliJ protein
MSWADSLIRIANFEVELLQKRLAEVVERRDAAQMARAVLEAEGEFEAARAREDAEAGWYHLGFQQGLNARKHAADAKIQDVAAEEQGARDALSEAFEALKKYEQVAENQRLVRVQAEAKRENAEYDEVGLRKAVAGRR